MKEASMRIVSLLVGLALSTAWVGLRADAVGPDTETVPSTTAATRAQFERREAKIARLQARTRALEAQTQALQAQNQGGDTAAARPAALASAGAAMVVTLKDGQKADLILQSYDHFFLTALNSKGTRFDLPWTQVASVACPNAGADLALMRGNITSDRAAVDSIIDPRYPSTAFERALWPGLILHGAGFRYAGDGGTFVDLAGAEIFGVVVGAFGLYLNSSPNKADSSKVVPQTLSVAGGVIFVGTWLWDLCFSPGAARALDNAKGLALEPLPQ